MKTGCYDNTGQKRKHLDTWTVNNCRTCTCRVSTWAQTVSALEENLYRQCLLSNPFVLYNKILFK